MNPNDYLAVAIHYLATHRPDWSADAAVGKTVVSSGMIDRVVRGLGRPLTEVPVGFKWFAPGLFDGTCCFGGEESAGASFLRRDGTVWTTDKDGLIMDLRGGDDRADGQGPGEQYRGLTARIRHRVLHAHRRAGDPCAEGRPCGADARGRDRPMLAGEPITAKLTRAPGNQAPIGGLKVVAAHGWFAAPPWGPRMCIRSMRRASGTARTSSAIVREAAEKHRYPGVAGYALRTAVS